MLRRFCAFAALLACLLLAPAAAQAAVTHTASAAASGTGSAAASLTVPAGSGRYLVVGVSTVEAATVTSVSFGPQLLTRERASAKDSSRAEVWVLKAPNAGTAEVRVTVSGNAPVVAGASTFTGVDQTLPIIASTSIDAANASNSAALALNQNVEADGLFGVISINDADNITAIRNTGSADMVTADTRWSAEQGTVVGAGATRRGWTMLNQSTDASINWYWNRIDPSHLMPYSYVLTGLRQATTTAPTVGSPIASTVTHESATLGGSVADTGGEPVTQRGVVYCLGSCTPAIGGADVVDRTAGAGDAGPFTVDVTGLTPSRTYTFRAYATNAKGTSYTASTPFTTAPQPNRAPVVSTGGPYAIDEGSPLTVTGSATDADGDTLSYQWDVDGDGSYEASGPTQSLSASQARALGLGDGPKTVTARLRVSDGTTATVAQTTITVRNVAPSGSLTYTASVVEGESNTVFWSSPSDPGDTDLTYAFDIGDDGTWDVVSSNPSLTVPTTDGPGDIKVRSEIRDKDGGAFARTVTFGVRNAAPRATVTGDTVDEGETATVTVTDVRDVAADLPGIRYAYDLDGDGTFELTDSTATELAVPTSDGPGTRTVRVRVSDKDGDANTYTATVTVKGVAPRAALSSSGPVDEGQTAQVAFADASDPSSADTAAGFRYRYDFDDDGTWDLGGSTYATAVTTATATVPAGLTADGDRDVTVRAAIVDKDGDAREYTTTIKVRNVAPIATLTGATVDEGATATVTFSDADDVPADEAAGFTYEFDLDGDGVFELKGTDPKATLKTTNGPATLPVKGAIIDRDGGRREYTTAVVVRNLAPTLALAGTGTATAGQPYALTLTAADAGGDALTGMVDWGDGADDAFAPTLAHAYAAAGTYTVTATVRDADGAETVATHAVTVAAAPAPPAAPAPTPAPNSGVAGVEASNLKITSLRVTGSRCVSRPNLRAVTSAAKTLKVQFRLSAGAKVKFTLKRWGKSATKCPPTRGVEQKGGSRIPGTYSPFSNRSVTAKAGLNTVTLATTAGKGKALKPGTYLLTITAGDVTARTKVWVLAR